MPFKSPVDLGLIRYPAQKAAQALIAFPNAIVGEEENPARKPWSLSCLQVLKMNRRFVMSGGKGPVKLLVDSNEEVAGRQFSQAES